MSHSTIYFFDFMHRISKPAEDEKEPVQLRILHSFRRLSSTDDVSNVYSSSDCERETTCAAKKSSDVLQRKHSKSSHSSILECQRVDDSRDLYEEVCLFIYSSGSMRLLLLLDMESSKDPKLIKTLVRQFRSSFFGYLDCMKNLCIHSICSGNTDPRAFVIWRPL